MYPFFGGILKYLLLLLYCFAAYCGTAWAQEMTPSQPTTPSQTTTPWQRLEYLCEGGKTLAQIIPEPTRMTLIFGTAFYPMRQVEQQRETSSGVRYESEALGPKIVWFTQQNEGTRQGEGTLLQEDGAILAQNCVLQEEARGEAETPQILMIPPETLSYTCKDEVVVTVTYFNDTAQLFVSAPTYGEQTFELPLVVSVSGAKFSNGSATWFTEGDEANLFEEAEEVQHAEACKRVTNEAAMETLTGTVVYLQRIALPENAVIQVQLQDVSRQDVAAIVLAEQTIAAQGQQVPIPFSLSYDLSRPESNHTYALSVRITVNGELHWIKPSKYVS
jgi:putative lipoprotein